MTTGRSTRSQRARALARRVDRHGRPPSGPAQWSALAAIWIHLGALVVVRLLTPPSAGPEADARFVELIRTSTAGSADGIRVAQAPRPGAPPRATPAEAASGPHPPEGAAAADLDAPPEPDLPARRVVRTDAATAERAPPADIESAHDVAAETESAAPVTSDRAGPQTPPSDGLAQLPGSPTLEPRDGDPDAALGNRAAGRPAPVVLGGGGGSPATPAANQRDLDPGAETTGGSPPTGPAGGADARIAATGAASALQTTAPEGPDATRAVGGPSPEWWQPLATRAAPEPTPASAVGAPVAARDPVQPPVPAERIGRRGISGGARRVADLVAEPPLPVPEREEPGTRRIAAVGTADPVAELREALGFGPLDRSTLAPRPSWAGLHRQDGQQDSSAQATLDASISWRTVFSARGTVEGAYIQQVSEQIEGRWASSDLDLHSRATGVQGEVTVRYGIRRDGRTYGVRVVRSSGNAALDDLARAAIPPRLERFPPDLREHALQHEVTFRYRNPLVGP